MDGKLILNDTVKPPFEFEEVVEEYVHPHSNSARKEVATWACSCGGPQSSCQGESVQCVVCSDQHHEACALDLLKGTCPIAKYALLRTETFQCWSCNPNRYTWLFQCSCLAQGLAVVANFDDGADMVECIGCQRWSHPACKHAAPDVTEVGSGIPADAADAAVAAVTEGEIPKVASDESSDLVSLSPHKCLGCRSAPFSDIDAPTEISWYRFDPPAGESAIGVGEIFHVHDDARFTPIRAPEPPTPPGIERMGYRVRFSKLPRLHGLYLRNGQRDDKIVNEVIVKGVYERPKFDFEITASDTWLDLGAHIGVFCSLALVAGARVIAVEPESVNFELLEKNSRLNSTFPDQCSLVQAAVVGTLGDYAGEPSSSSSSLCSPALVQSSLIPSLAAASISLSTKVTDAPNIATDDTNISDLKTTTLYVHPTIAFRHSTLLRRRRFEWGSVQVRATTLKMLLETHPTITSVKCDIQGSEVAVIQSVTNWHNVKKLVFEYDFEYSPDCTQFHEFIASLRGHFPYIHHAKVPESGSFKGFPNGVVVFAKTELPIKWSAGTLLRSEIRSTVQVKDKFLGKAAGPTPVMSPEKKDSTRGLVATSVPPITRPKRRLAGLGVPETFDGASYMRNFKCSKSAILDRETGLGFDSQQSGSEIEVDEEEIQPHGSKRQHASTHAATTVPPITRPKRRLAGLGVSEIFDGTSYMRNFKCSNSAIVDRETGLGFDSQQNDDKKSTR